MFHHSTLTISINAINVPYINLDFVKRILEATTKKRYSDTTIQRYNDTAIRELEPEPRIIYANYRTLSLLETEVIIFFRGGRRIVSEQFVKISLNHKEQYSSVKSHVYIYCLA